MDQLNNYADSRLLPGCVYCDNPADTRDHVPSKCLLERPYPPNLPVVGCCETCNQNFSKDEQYFVCLIECVLCGSTDPEKIVRPSVAKMLKDSPALRQRIENSRTEFEGQVAFAPEFERLSNVMLKLARGHAAFELSQPCTKKPHHFWCGPLLSLSEETRERFNEAHIQESCGEVSSRNMQRFMGMQIAMPFENGDTKNVAMVMNDWIDVQENRYRYLAIDDLGEIVIRIVIAEYLACEVAWRI